MYDLTFIYQAVKSTKYHIFINPQNKRFQKMLQQIKIT